MLIWVVFIPLLSALILEDSAWIFVWSEAQMRSLHPTVFESLGMLLQCRWLISPFPDPNIRALVWPIHTSDWHEGSDGFPTHAISALVHRREIWRVQQWHRCISALCRYKLIARVRDESSIWCMTFLLWLFFSSRNCNAFLEARLILSTSHAFCMRSKLDWMACAFLLMVMMASAADIRSWYCSLWTVCVNLHVGLWEKNSTSYPTMARSSSFWVSMAILRKIHQYLTTCKQAILIRTASFVQMLEHLVHWTR